MILNDNMRVDPNPEFILRGGGGPQDNSPPSVLMKGEKYYV